MEDSYNEMLNPIIQGEQYYYSYNGMSVQKEKMCLNVIEKSFIKIAAVQNEANAINVLNEVQEKKSGMR
jgi:ArsR family metal-binding transcriptional regulator